MNYSKQKMATTFIAAILFLKVDLSLFSQKVIYRGYGTLNNWIINLVDHHFSLAVSRNNLCVTQNT